MLLVITIILAAISCLLLLLFPQLGVLTIYVIRPLIDTTWDKYIFLGFKLTELVSVAVPLIVIVLVIINSGTSRSLTKMPFWRFWVLYLLYISTFCLNIAITSSIIDAANVFFRFANGFVGFYLVQAYFLESQKYKLFFFALIIAGIFPIATGLYEAITGIHWKVTTAEGQIRNIGMYHDAITIRYYGLQTVLAVAACYAYNYPKIFLLKLPSIGVFFGGLIIVFKALS